MPHDLLRSLSEARLLSKVLCRRQGQRGERRTPNRGSRPRRRHLAARSRPGRQTSAPWPTARRHLRSLQAGAPRRRSSTCSRSSPRPRPCSRPRPWQRHSRCSPWRRNGSCGSRGRPRRRRRRRRCRSPPPQTAGAPRCRSPWAPLLGSLPRPRRRSRVREATPRCAQRGS